MININKIKIRIAMSFSAFITAGFGELQLSRLDKNLVLLNLVKCYDGTEQLELETADGYYVCEVPAPKVDPREPEIEEGFVLLEVPAPQADPVEYEANFRKCLTHAVSKGQTLGPVEEGKIYVNWFLSFPVFATFCTKRDGKVILCDKFGKEVPIYSESGAYQMLDEVLAGKPQEDFHIDIKELQRLSRATEEKLSARR